MTQIRFVKGKTTVVITGGNSGIGLAMVGELLQDGYRVAVLDIETNNLDSLRNRSGNLLVFKSDITSDRQVQQAINSVVEKWAHIDVLINNACVAIFKDFTEKAIAETRQEFEVNYFGYLRLIQAVFPYMKEAGQGIIHNVSSGVGITGFPKIYGYASTKGAIEALTRSLALEFKQHNIVVNVMHPPLSDTASARPLGIPPQMMEDAQAVGKKLAKQVLSTKNIVTPDFKTRLSMFFTLKFPFALGGLLSSLTEKQQT